MSGAYTVHPEMASEKQKCREFLQEFEIGGELKYRDQLQEIADRKRVVLEVSMDDIVDFRNDDEFAANMERNTKRYILLFEEEVDSLLPVSDLRHSDDIYDVLREQRNAVLHANSTLNTGMDVVEADGQAPVASDAPKSLIRRFEVVILPRKKDVAKRIREVRAEDIGTLLSIKGLVTRATDVKPQIAVVTYTCDVCGSEIFQEVIANQFMPLQKCPSQRCIDNKSAGKIQMQTRGSRFVKYQEMRVQELPDQVPVGHIPRTMRIICRGELTRQCSPGDKITVSGLFLTVRYNGYHALSAGLQADTYLEATQILKQKLGYDELISSGHMPKQVMAIARDLDPYSRLATSIAPEIFGHDDVKKALLIQLVGGVTRNLNDGMKIRGDINVCLMGDPGVAKSQLLKYIATVSPRGIYTTGKGSSGVGLTAAVIRDSLTGDIALEGGALVMADKGICCIDEFDKMDENDRTAIHEVMEQQTISIAKAGITTSLNARTAVLAAANPLYGRYNRRKSISENVDLPNSLLSRFDLLFLIIDKADVDNDRAMSMHVLHVHKFLRTPDPAINPIDPASIKQYIAHARDLNPTIPSKLTSYIVEAYVSLRSLDNSRIGSYDLVTRTQNDQTVMTARQLLSILRLSQALARLRLANEVSNEDIDESIRLIYSSKASLFDDDDDVKGREEDPTSAIFSLLRDFSVQHKTDEVDFNVIEQMVIKKGYSTAQLRSTLSEYELLQVIHVHDNKIVLDH